MFSCCAYLGFVPPTAITKITNFHTSAHALVTRRHSAFTAASQIHAPVSSFTLLPPSRKSVIRNTAVSTPATTTPSPTAPIPAVAPSTPPPPLRPPAGAFEAAATLGASKARQPWWKILLLGFSAGAYIGLGALLALTVGGNAPALKTANAGLHKLLMGAVGLPVGLTLVCTAGGELFTGNTALVTSALLTGRTRPRDLAKNWLWSYLGNFAGSLFVVWLALQTATVGGASAATSVGIAAAKTSMSFGMAFWRGLACNWLVCLAVYLATAAAGLPGKFLAIWLPVSTFVALGFEHSVANMFLIPMGIALGAKVSLKAFLLANLVPVTLGNVLGGGLLVAGVYFLSYGR